MISRRTLLVIACTVGIGSVVASSHGEEAALDVVLHQSMSIALDPQESAATRLQAIRALRSFAIHHSSAPNTSAIISPVHSEMALQTLLFLLTSSDRDIVDHAALQICVITSYDRTKEELNLSPRNQRKSEIVIASFPALILNDSASDFTRRRAAEKLAETEELLRAFRKKERGDADSDRFARHQAWSLAQTQVLIESLSEIQQHFASVQTRGRIPPFAIVCSNLLNAIVENHDLRDTPGPGKTVSASLGTGNEGTPLVDSSLQPVAASSMASAVAKPTVGSDAPGFTVSTRLLGVATTSDAAAARAGGLRGDYVSGADGKPVVSPGRRSALRVPGKRLTGTTQDDRISRSRGATGARRTGFAPGADPSSKPRQAKPATPASPANP
jgi:hypothetical protein